MLLNLVYFYKRFINIQLQKYIINKSELILAQPTEVLIVHDDIFQS